MYISKLRIWCSLLDMLGFKGLETIWIVTDRYCRELKAFAFTCYHYFFTMDNIEYHVFCK